MARRYPFVFIFLVTALCICSAYYFRFPWNLRADTEADYLDSTAVYRMHVLEPPVRKPYGYLLSVRLISMYRADSVRLLSQQAMLRLNTDSVTAYEPALGDLLLVRTRVTRPRALFIGEFDYGNYLRLQHKVGIAYASSAQCRLIGHVPVRSLRARAALLQHRLAERYAVAGLSGRAQAFVAAITLGEKDELDSDLRRSFAAAGAAHVLAVSGLHTGIIYAVVVALLTLFKTRRPLYEQRFRRFLLAAAVLLAMWLYAFITGLSPSVLRAVLMITVVQVGWVLRRDSVSVNTLAAAACICLWADPISLFSVSFQLSFTAVLGILLFVPYMNRLIRVSNGCLRFLRDLVTVSIAAMVGTLPVTLYYFGQVAHYFLLANVVVLPAAIALVVLGMAVLVLAHTPVGAWLAYLLQHLADWTCDYVGWVEHLPASTLQLSVTPAMLVCLVLCIACYYLYLRRSRLAWLVPSVACIALFCTLHVRNVQKVAAEQAIALRGRTLYYKHGATIDRYPLSGRYTFFRFRDTDYVYAPYISSKKRQMLRQYCQKHHISLIQSSD